MSAVVTTVVVVSIVADWILHAVSAMVVVDVVSRLNISSAALSGGSQNGYDVVDAVATVSLTMVVTVRGGGIIGSADMTHLCTRGSTAVVDLRDWRFNLVVRPGKAS
jgi:hypothetical protein